MNAIEHYNEIRRREIQAEAEAMAHDHDARERRNNEMRTYMRSLSWIKANRPNWPPDMHEAFASPLRDPAHYERDAAQFALDWSNA